MTVLSTDQNSNVAMVIQQKDLSPRRPFLKLFTLIFTNNSISHQFLYIFIHIRALENKSRIPAFSFLLPRFNLGWRLTVYGVTKPTSSIPQLELKPRLVCVYGDSRTTIRQTPFLSNQVRSVAVNVVPDGCERNILAECTGPHQRKTPPRSREKYFIKQA